jgi:hypothetical protein
VTDACASDDNSKNIWTINQYELSGRTDE